MFDAAKLPFRPVELARDKFRRRPLCRCDFGYFGIFEMDSGVFLNNVLRVRHRVF